MSEHLSDTIKDARGQTLFAPVLACLPADLKDLSPQQKESWDRAVGELGIEPPSDYPGSVRSACDRCSLPVLIGPSQQEQLRATSLIGLRRIVVCLMCAAPCVADLEQERAAHGPDGWQ